MRRIYALLWILSLAGMYFLGYHNGQPAVDNTAVDVILHRADSLQVLVDASQRREAAYADSVRHAMRQSDSLEQAIIIRDIAAVNNRKYYEKRIKELGRYSIDQLDSFFMARYPRPGTRIPTDTSRQHGLGATLESPDDSPDGGEIRFSGSGEQSADEGLRGSEEDIRAATKDHNFPGRADIRMSPAGGAVIRI